MKFSDSFIKHIEPPATARTNNEKENSLIYFLDSVNPCLTERNINSDVRQLHPISKIISKHNALVSPIYKPVGPSTRYLWRKGDVQDKPLGSGYTSTVYRGIDRETGELVAIKLVPKKKQRLLASESYYRRLYRWLPSHSHPNILRLRDFFEDVHYFYIVSDLYTGSDLVDYVLSYSPRSIPTDKIKRITLQLLLGLYHLHSFGLLHRDIKLDNVIFDSNIKEDIVIVDFDMSYFYRQSEYPKPQKGLENITIVGTKDYMAPENYYGIYSEASDLWSVGVILYILLDGHFPFDLTDITNPKTIREVLKNGITVLPEVTKKYPKAVDLVRQLLVYNPTCRIRKAKDALMHPWFDSEKQIIQDILDKKRYSLGCVHLLSCSPAAVSHFSIPHVPVKGLGTGKNDYSSLCLHERKMALNHYYCEKHKTSNKAVPFLKCSPAMYFTNNSHLSKRSPLSLCTSRYSKPENGLLEQDLNHESSNDLEKKKHSIPMSARIACNPYAFSPMLENNSTKRVNESTFLNPNHLFKDSNHRTRFSVNDLNYPVSGNKNDDSISSFSTISTTNEKNKKKKNHISFNFKEEFNGPCKKFDFSTPTLDKVNALAKYYQYNNSTNCNGGYWCDPLPSSPRVADCFDSLKGLITHRQQNKSFDK